MSNVAALLKARAIDIHDGIYLERSDPREHAFEEYLRSVVTRFPKLKTRTGTMRRFVDHVNVLEDEMRALDRSGLIDVLKECGISMRRGGFTEAPTARAFAAIREAATRTLGQRHYDVQLMGGWSLLQGKIAEMETGEGKTLAATLAACSVAAAGAAVHIITVNDYLAERDATFNAPLYEYFNLDVGYVIQGMTPTERRTQYARAIVYVSNKELVFDYLKDRIAVGDASAAHFRLRRLYRRGRDPEVLLRGLHVAIVDEADSVLIDEARTPLIISETRPNELGSELYHQALGFAKQFLRGEHFELNNQRDLWLTDKGERLSETLTMDLSGVWRSAVWRRELLEKALSALWCFHRDQHYIVTEGKVQIVDEFSGRVMQDRSWEHGLHQMVEAKENCEITGQRNTLSRITYQRFFRRYLLLGGMTGTATEVATELSRVYDIEVQKIPTHKPCLRQRLPDRVYPTAAERWRAVSMRAKELSQQGRAVLIGTRSVEASETLSHQLTHDQVEHTVLNARQDKQEAEIIALAGQPGRITVATNMAGRGTDIRIAPEVAASDGLHVILTEYHETARIDRQLFGRCARQGEPGTVEVLVSLEDELFTRYAPLLRRIAQAITVRLGSLPEWFLSFFVRYAQTVAEYQHARVRISTLKQDRKLQSMLAFSGNSR